MCVRVPFDFFGGVGELFFVGFFFGNDTQPDIFWVHLAAYRWENHPPYGVQPRASLYWPGSGLDSPPRALRLRRAPSSPGACLFPLIWGFVVPLAGLGALIAPLLENL